MNSQRVFIIGAGFSTCTGLPLSSNLFAKWMEWMEKNSDSELIQIREQLRILAYIHLASNRGWQNYKSQKWHDEINIEQLLTTIDTTNNFWNTFFEKDDKSMKSLKLTANNYIDIFTRSIGLYFYSTTRTCNKKWDPIVKFCENLHNGDSIITYNWDTIFEQIISYQKKKFRYGIGDKNHIGLLKLHGSIDWIAPEIDENHNKKYTKKIYNKIYRIVDFSKFMDNYPESYIPFIVPPSARKFFDSTIQHFWKEANSSLFSVSKVFIIGYSMPSTDWASQSLLRLAFRPELRDIHGNRSSNKKLYIINPNPEVILRYQKIVFPKAIGIQKTLKDIDWSHV